MRKCLAAVAILFCTLFLGACEEDGLPGNTVKDMNVYATEINLVNTTKLCYVGDIFLVDENIFTITPSNATVYPTVLVSGDDVLSYDKETNKVICKNEGSAVVEISVPINKSSSISKSLTIRVIPRPTNVEELSVELVDMNMYVGDTVRNLLSIMPADCQKNIEITYSEDGIITYDGYYVKALAKGKVTVTCKDTYTKKSVSFKVNSKIDNNVYATDINIKEPTKNCCVGDCFVLDDKIFEIMPANVSVLPKIEISGDVIKYDPLTKRITCTGVGSAMINITIATSRTSSVTKLINVQVVPAPIDVEELTVEKTNVEMNFGDNAVRNLLTILPNDSRRDIDITYSTEGIVTYDGYYIRAISAGSTTVTCVDKFTHKSVSFDVVVTNYIYTTKIVLDKTAYCFGVGKTGKISYSVLPATSNTKIRFVSLDENIVSIDQNGNCIANNVGETIINLYYETSKGVENYVSVIVSVVDELNIISAKLTYENSKVDRVFTDTSLKYCLTISSDKKIDIANLTILVNDKKLTNGTDMRVSRVTSSKGNDIVYEITFLCSGEYSFVVNYKNPNEEGRTISAKVVTVTSYNVLKDISHSLYVDGVELDYENAYNMVLVDADKPIDAGVPYKGILKIITSGVLYDGGYTYKFVDAFGNETNDITFDEETGEIIVRKAGSYSLIIIGTDIKANEIKVNFNVKELVVSDIKNGDKDMPSEKTLYLDGIGEDYPSFIEINPVMIPEYAYNSNLVVKISDEDIIRYVGGKIIATGIGSATITFKSGSVEKTIAITVEGYIKKVTLDRLFSTLNDITTSLPVDNNITINLVKGSALDIALSAVASGYSKYDYFQFECFGDVIFDQTVSDFHDVISLNTIAVGEAKIVLTTKSRSEFTFVINVKVREYVEIKDIGYDESYVKINTADKEEMVFDLSAKITPNNGYDDVVSYTIDNDTIATIDNNGILRLINNTREGKVTICVFVNNVKVTSIEVEFVYEIPATSVDFENSEKVVKLGEVEVINNIAIVLPQNHTSQITYKSNNESVAIVDNNGAVSIVGVGDAIISILADGVSLGGYKIVVEKSLMTAKEVILALKNNQDITLTNDIVLPDDFETISSYSGSFDGGNFVISNLKTTFIEENLGEIKNICFDANLVLSSSETATICNNNKGIFRNITLNGTVTCTTAGSFAGFVYNNAGTISNCNVNSKVGAEVNVIFSGFVYTSSGDIADSMVSGEIYGSTKCAGFIYRLEGGTISNCKSLNLKISSSEDLKIIVAGFVYEATSTSSGKITDCLADVLYSGGTESSQIGGFVYNYYEGNNVESNNSTSKVSLESVNTSAIGLFVCMARASSFYGDGSFCYSLNDFKTCYTFNEYGNIGKISN